MSKFVKKAAKGTKNLTGDALKKAFSAMLGDIVKDIMEETGVADVAKAKIMEAGLKVVKEMGIDPKSMQRDLVKTAIMRELKL